MSENSNGSYPSWRRVITPLSAGTNLILVTVQMSGDDGHFLMMDDIWIMNCTKMGKFITHLHYMLLNTHTSMCMPKQCALTEHVYIVEIFTVDI